MIKTLRTTSLIILLGVVVFAIFLIVGEVYADEQVDELLNSPTIMDKFKEMQNISEDAEDVKSPLVQEAEKFAKYLNPPAPKKPKRVLGTGPPTAALRPQVVSVKFDLIGTSYYASNPDLSLALIDQPGKGFQWVKESDTVGRMVIKQIKDGIIVVNDGLKSVELHAKRAPKKSLLRSSSLNTVKASPFPSVVAENLPETYEYKEQRSEKETALFEQLVGKLQTKVDRDSNSPEQSAAQINELFSEFREAQSRISEEEANSLDELGKELKDANETQQQSQQKRKRKIIRGGDVSSRRRR